MFMMNFGSVYISKIWGTVHFDEVSIEKVTYQNVDITGVVGNVPPNYDVDPIFGAKTITNLDSLDDSNKVLLFFVMTVLVSIAFFAVYIIGSGIIAPE